MKINMHLTFFSKHLCENRPKFLVGFNRVKTVAKRIAAFPFSVIAIQAIELGHCTFYFIPRAGRDGKIGLAWGCIIYLSAPALIRRLINHRVGEDKWSKSTLTVRAKNPDVACQVGQWLGADKWRPVHARSIYIFIYLAWKKLQLATWWTVKKLGNWWHESLYSTGGDWLMLPLEANECDLWMPFDISLH